jgi:manganese transport protein
MEKKTFMQKLKNMGPAAIITSAFIGPGTITTATLVGVKFQYALLWAVVFSGIALIVLMEMSSRIAIASHKNVIDAAIALKPESRGWRLFVQIFVGLAVGISCFAFQSGNEIGASAGLQDITGMPQWVSALIIGVIALIAALASNKVLETIMQVFVSVMGVLFLVTAIAVAPNLGQVVTGLVPVVPEGGLMNTMALIGTTLIGMNLILHSITSQGKYTSIEELPDARFDIRFNIIIGIIITASILITSGTVLYGTGTSVNGALTFTKSLEPVLGSWARVVGDIGLLAAGLSSAIAVGFTFKTIFSALFHWEGGSSCTKAKLLAIIVIVFGTVLAMVNTSPAAIIVAAQAISGFILPFIAILLLVIANSKKLLGNYTNSVIRNVLGGIAAVATLVWPFVPCITSLPPSLNNIFVPSMFFPKYIFSQKESTHKVPSFCICTKWNAKNRPAQNRTVFLLKNLQQDNTRGFAFLHGIIIPHRRLHFTDMGGPH